MGGLKLLAEFCPPDGARGPLAPTGLYGLISLNQGGLVCGGACQGPLPRVHHPKGLLPRVHHPKGPLPRVHRPKGPLSRVHRPKGPLPRVHRPKGPLSRVHRPKGPLPRVHRPKGPLPRVHRPIIKGYLHSMLQTPFFFSQDMRNKEHRYCFSLELRRV